MTQANYTNISFNTNTFFSGYVADNNIYTINGELIGVNLGKYQEVEQGLITCKNRLIELGEIKVPKTQEEIIKEQSEMLEKQQIILNEIMAKMELFKNEQKFINGVDEFSTRECKEQEFTSTRESLTNDRPNKNKDETRCTQRSARAKE